MMSQSVDGAEASEIMDRPGRFGGLYYGWVMLPVAMVGVVCSTPGQTFGIAPFNASLRATLNLTHSQLTAAYMFGTLFAALPLTYLGLMMDRHGLRRTMTVAVLGMGLACLVAALANNVFSLFVAFFLLRLLGPGAMSLLSTSTLAFWFHRRLGMMEGVRHLAMAGVIGLAPGLNLWLIERFGWRFAFALLGLTVCGLMLPLLAFVFRNRPEDVGQSLDDAPLDARSAGPLQGTEADFTFAQAVRSRAFWIVLGINSLWALIVTGLTFNIVPIFQSQGLADQHAVAMLSVFALTLAGTHLIGGMLADRMSLHLLLALAGACMAAASWGLGNLTLPGIALGCGVAMGMAQGLSTGITSVICVRYFGRRHLGQIRSAFSTATIAASSLGPFLIGLARDWTGAYGGILGLFTLLASVAFLAALFATAPKSPARDSLAEDVGEEEPDSPSECAQPAVVPVSSR